VSTVNLSLDGKVAVITGGSKGIGRAIALAFAEHGASVAIAARGAEALEATRKDLEAQGGGVLAVQADVSEAADLERLHAEVSQAFGGVDVLVNNAATGDEGRELAKLTREEFDRVLSVNLWAAIRLSQLCRPSMQERGGGTILNIVSNEAIRPMAGLGIYSPSKAALVNLTQMVAKEWAGDGIRAVCIAPGLVRTELAAPLVKIVEEHGVKLNPLGTIGEPEDIAGLALFLASPAGKYATGTTFVVDGGEMAAGPMG
jgi:NAD(P)-dependent dehydrogenase (short-subunit alcohol dehydrogenase family)